MKIDNSKLSKKLFLGVFLDSEKRMLLSQSVQWKQVKILPPTAQNELIEAHYQGKDYLGLYLSEALTSTQLDETKMKIQERMKAYCPTCETEEMKIFAFAQVFIS